MGRAMYLTNPVIQLAGGESPAEDFRGKTSTTLLGHEGLGMIDLRAPMLPVSPPDPPSVPQPPSVVRADVDDYL